jgi:hypothetical protein
MVGVVRDAHLVGGGLALSARQRTELARRAAEARWRKRDVVSSAADAPEEVRRLLKTYRPAALVWSNLDHRYAIVREILLRGDEGAARWLRSVLGRNQVRALVRRYRGIGASEPERKKLRRQLGLTIADIPSRPYLGFKWRSRG